MARRQAQSPTCHVPTVTASTTRRGSPVVVSQLLDGKKLFFRRGVRAYGARHRPKISRSLRARTSFPIARRQAAQRCSISAAQASSTSLCVASSRLSTSRAAILALSCSGSAKPARETWCFGSGLFQCSADRRVEKRGLRLRRSVGRVHAHPGRSIAVAPPGASLGLGRVDSGGHSRADGSQAAKSLFSLIG